MQSALQYLAVRVEAGDLTYPLGVGFVGSLGDQSDEFGVVDEDAVALSEVLNCCVNVAHGGQGEVGDCSY